MQNRALVSLLGIVLVAAGLLAGSLAAGNEPLLGLDLQGGVEVVLRPVDDGREVTDDQLDTAVDIIRDRVDALGVAEPDITRQGENVVVQLPGIDDQQRAIDLVGQTAELRFRPVLAGPFNVAELPPPPVEPVTGSLTVEDLLAGAITVPETDVAENSVVLDGDLGRYLLGPAEVTGAALEGADDQLIGVEWIVSVTMRPGPEGIDLFNEAAFACNNTLPQCPNGQLAIVLDQVVESAPNINASRYERDAISLTGGFSSDEARDIALVLDFGALPVEFEDPVESGLVRTVSATLGRDALRAGVISGIIGLVLVGAYMIGYYRLLGAAALASLVISATLLWVVVSFLSETQGLALTLAGVTGLIVSIGVSLDSNVVYFEHLKEDIVSGRALRSSVERAFPIAFKTIFWANLATLIGAVVLYVLTVGSVKGFALMLGIASVLDLVATYFFLRPAVQLLVASDRVKERPGLVGMPPEKTVFSS